MSDTASDHGHTSAVDDGITGRLDGQVALVTGGGSGIGLACAGALAADGAAVMLAGRSAERLASGRDELLAAQPGASVHTVVCDVTDEDAVADACSATATHGAFTMVVANAGFGSAAPIHLTTLEEWNSVLATNLTGAFLTIKHSVGHLAAAVRAGAGSTSIVAISSIAGAVTHRYMTPYDVSKAGLEMLVRQTADELGHVGIRANAVRPGLVPTDASQTLVSVPEIHDDYLEQMPLGRVGDTGDIARLVRFLLGPESGWITGTCISADGGHHLRRGPNLDPVMRMVLGDTVDP
jgi:NAD(P)-dependent dehydrogenase (short-subunit alcohol dehydrogenase family)